MWRERELNVKNDIVDVLRRSAAVVDSRITDLGIEIQKQIDEQKRMEAKLEEASREPGKSFSSILGFLLLSSYLLLKLCFVCQEGKKYLKNLKPWFLHFLSKWVPCKVNYVNTKRLLLIFILCRLMCSPFPAFLIGRCVFLLCNEFLDTLKEI